MERGYWGARQHDRSNTLTNFWRYVIAVAAQLTTSLLGNKTSSGRAKVQIFVVYLP